MNIGVAGLIGLVIFFVLLLMIGLILISVMKSRQPTVQLPKIPCSKQTDPNTLTVIPASQKPCVISGQVTPYYYLGYLNPKYDYVVAPFESQPVDVCVHFCTQLVDGTKCTGNQAKFDACMAQLANPACLGPTPLALREGTRYYPFYPTIAGCQTS